MRAVVQEKYGSPDDLKLRDVEIPSVGDGDVLVRVRAASIHPDVWHVVTGRPYILRFIWAGITKPKNPIPGTDMAGVVESVGKNVSAFRPGDEVFGETGPPNQWTNGGAYAEYVSVKPDWLALKPENVTFEQAAAVPTSGFIVLMNFREVSQLRPGQQVLVNGAGGGVGTIAVQLAKAYRAHVTAVDTAGKLEMLRTLGADRVIDYEREDFTTLGDRYHVIVDIPGDRPFSRFKPVLEPNGRYVPIGHDHFGAAGRRVFGLIPHFFRLIFLARFVKQLRGPGIPFPTRPEAMAQLAEHLAAGRLTPVVDRTFPLNEVPEALRYLQSGDVKGKIVITV